VDSRLCRTPPPSDDDRKQSGNFSLAARRGNATDVTSGEEQPVQRWRPGHARVPSGEMMHTPKVIITPALEKASPSLESGVRNPLSQAELFFNGGGATLVPSASRCASLNASPGPCHLVAASRTVSLNTSPGPCHLTNASRNASLDASPGEMSLDALSVTASAVPSGVQSPFCLGSITPTSVGASACEVVSVRIVNGVSGEEEVRFPVRVQAAVSEQHFLSMLDHMCQQHTGLALSGLNWLQQGEPGTRWKRRPCDLQMVQELFAAEPPPKGPTVLLLCTVPVRPPSELPPGKIRIKNMSPTRVSCGATGQVQVRLDTSLLEAHRAHTVAFTHQWTNMTYSTEAALLPNRRGVEATIPYQMLVLAATGASTAEGLYDVHLVIDQAVRSENRKALTVGSQESELSSGSATTRSAAVAFVSPNWGVA